MDLSVFKGENQPRIGSQFDAEAVAKYKGKVHDEIIEFWQEEGDATYARGFLRVVLPEEYHEILSEWGLDGPQCFVFMTTAVGGLIYWHNDNFYHLDCHRGLITDLINMPDLLFNNFLSAPTILEGIFWKETYISRVGEELSIKTDEMYAFVPALPVRRLIFSGKVSKSKLAVVKMKKHHSFLAKLFDNATRQL